MARNDNGVNWFGQVGANRTTQPRPQVSAPALSQIPGLNKVSGDAHDTDEPQRQFFRDTDSAYVRLAKQGGRTDLLRMDQDPVPSETKANAYAIPSWMQQDSLNEDLPNTAENVTCAQNTCFLPAMVSETRAAYTGDSLQVARSRHGGSLSPSHQFLKKKASMDLLKKPTLAEAQFTFSGKRHELKEIMKPGNYKGNHQLKARQQIPAVEAVLPQTPAYSTLSETSDERQSYKDAEKQISTMHCGSNPTSVTGTQAADNHGSAVAQFCQRIAAKSQAEVHTGEEKETQVELLQQIGLVNSGTGAADIEAEGGKEAGGVRIELQRQDSIARDRDDLDFLDNGSRTDQWDARQSSPPPGDRNSGSSWSRKMSAEGGRQSLQSESQSAFANKQSGDDESPANRHNDRFQKQYSRQNVADASGTGRTSFQSPEEKSHDNTRPDWLQWNPANNSRRESASGRHHEENVDARGSPYGHYQGNSSPQKPYADHGYQMPLSSETSSAYSEKPFQSPAGERRSSTSKLQEEFYGKNTYQQPSVTSNHQQQQQQPAGVNRMKHSDSMSKLLSFGYLKESEKDPRQVAAGQSQPRIEQGYVPNTYTTEYKEKMHSIRGTTGANSSAPHSASIQSAGTYVPTPISDPGYRRRKQSFDDRPDFFKIGSTDPQSVAAYGIRKPSAEARPDFFGNEHTDLQSTVAYGFRKPSAETRPDFFGDERASSAATVSYGKTRHEGESKPDFFKIGSLDNYMDKHVDQKKPDDGGILDKLNGYHGISQKTNFRRRKMDINGPMLTMPVKAVSRF